MKSIDKTVAELLSIADIEVGGSRPQDIEIHNNNLYGRVLKDRELGLGEAYMDGWWTSKRPDMTITNLMTSDIGSKVKLSPSMVVGGAKSVLKSSVVNLQSVERARKNAQHHYNIGNDLYELMLDDRMIYSC
jgi:cyclopropane-fatty-acyl-phospholipid synthase